MLYAVVTLEQTTLIILSKRGEWSLVQCKYTKNVQFFIEKNQMTDYYFSGFRKAFNRSVGL